MKIKLLFLFCLLLAATDFAQNQGPEVELPNFVIYGTRKKKARPVLKVKKAKPRRVVKTLPKEFFTPVKAPEEFPGVKYSDPLKQGADLRENLDVSQAELKVGLGNNTVPKGSFFYSRSNQSLLFKAGIFGLNERKFVPFGGYNTSGGNLSLDYYLKSSQDILNGMKLSANADYKRDSYNFYGSDSPQNERKTDRYGFGIGFLNQVERNYNYSFSLSDKQISLKERAYKDNLISLMGNLRYRYSSFYIDVSGTLSSQNTKADSIEDKSGNYLNIRGSISLRPMSFLNLKAGATLSHLGSSTVVYPFGQAEMRLSDRLSVLGEFNPDTKLLTTESILAKCRYYSLNRENLLVKNKFEMKGALRFQYDKYYEASAGLGYCLTDNFPYFSDRLVNGYYDLKTAGGLDQFSFFANMLYHMGPWGSFYGNAKYLKLSNSEEKNLPYYPKFSLDFRYSLPLSAKLSFDVKYSYASLAYAETDSRDALPVYNSLSVEGNYRLFQNLKIFAGIEDITNRKNYIFKNYQEKPFDLLCGLDYFF